MTASELNNAQARLNLSTRELARALGMSERSLYYRKAGKLPVRRGESILIRSLLTMREVQGE